MINPEKHAAPPELTEQMLLQILNCSLLELDQIPEWRVQRHVAVYNARQEGMTARRAAHG